MTIFTRRSVLRSSLAVAAAGTIARPFIANAAAKTATVWWTQGFVAEEDAAFKRIVDEYQKQSGNIIDFSLIPFAPLMQKIVSAITSGDVPDLISHDINEQVVVPQNAWDDKLVDASRRQRYPTKDNYASQPVYLATQYYNNATKKRGAYMIPYKTAVLPLSHLGLPLVEKAGYKLSDAPKTWDAFLGFLLADAGGSCATRGMRKHLFDGPAVHQDRPGRRQQHVPPFLIARGGNGFVTKDGKVHLDDPQVKEAVIKSLTYFAAAIQGRLCAVGCVELERRRRQQRLPLEAVRDGPRRDDLDGGRRSRTGPSDAEVTTMGLPNKNDGTPMTAELGIGGAFIPKGAKSIDVAK